MSCHRSPHCLFIQKTSFNHLLTCQPSPRRTGSPCFHAPPDRESSDLIGHPGDGSKLGLLDHTDAYSQPPAHCLSPNRGCATPDVCPTSNPPCRRSLLACTSCTSHTPVAAVKSAQYRNCVLTTYHIILTHHWNPRPVALFGFEEATLMGLQWLPRLPHLALPPLVRSRPKMAARMVASFGN